MLKVQNIMLKVQNCFFNTIQPLSLDIKPPSRQLQVQS